MTSHLVHTVAQPTKWRFLPKNLNQLPSYFVIGLVFTWSRVEKNRAQHCVDFRKQTTSKNEVTYMSFKICFEYFGSVFTVTNHNYILCVVRILMKQTLKHYALLLKKDFQAFWIALEQLESLYYYWCFISTCQGFFCFCVWTKKEFRFEKDFGHFQSLS